MAIDGSAGAGQAQWARAGASPALGARLPPLVGRAGELAELRSRLLDPDTALVTIVGPAGCGKTRLALAVAQDLASALDDRVAFMDLAPLTDAGGVLSHLAGALGVPEQQSDLGAAIAGSIGDRSTLVILDNAEHVLAAAASLAALLQATRGLTLLVTSRTPLGLYGEREFPLDPLPVPTNWEAVHEGDPDVVRVDPRLGDCPSVQLFVQTARMVRPDFELTPANAPAVAEICSRLDGLPLAIELAAARVKLLSPEALLRRLAEPATSPLRELTSTAANRPERHRTLDRAIDSSYATLTTEEQRLFRAVSIFAGGFDLEAAEALVSPSLQPAPDPRTGTLTAEARTQRAGEDVFRGLSTLVNHSLIRRAEEEPEGVARFSMLATIREFGLAQLSAAGEVDRVHDAHVRFLLALAESVDPHRGGPTVLHPRLSLERDWDSLRAALHWAVAERDDPLVGLRLAGALSWFWKHGWRRQEGREWLRTALDAAPDAPDLVRARALLALGAIDFSLDDIPAAMTSLETAVELARPSGDALLLGLALNKLACVLAVAGDRERGLALYEEAMASFRRCDDAAGAAAVRNGLGEADRSAGDYAAARAHYEASLTGAGDPDVSGRLAAVVHHNLGYIAEHEGDVPAMAACFQRALGLAVDLADQSLQALCVAGLGAASRAAGDVERAARLFGAFEAWRERVQLRLDPPDREAYERNAGLVRRALGEAGHARAWEAGSSLTPDEALTEARAVDGHPPKPASVRRTDSPNALTRREVEVALLVARGLTNRQIAAELTIAERTAGTHIEHIMAKLGIHSRAQIAGWVAEQRPRPLPDPLRVA